MPRVSFKAKAITLRYLDGTTTPARLKIPTLTRAHCDMREFRASPKWSAIANSDFFLSGINKAARAKCGNAIRLDAIPEGVTVDASGFLAQVTIEL